MNFTLGSNSIVAELSISIINSHPYVLASSIYDELQYTTNTIFSYSYGDNALALYSIDIWFCMLYIDDILILFVLISCIIDLVTVQ